MSSIPYQIGSFIHDLPAAIAQHEKEGERQRRQNIENDQAMVRGAIGDFAAPWTGAAPSQPANPVDAQLRKMADAANAERAKPQTSMSPLMQQALANSPKPAAPGEPESPQSVMARMNKPRPQPTFENLRGMKSREFKDDTPIFGGVQSGGNNAMTGNQMVQDMRAHDLINARDQQARGVIDQREQENDPMRRMLEAVGMTRQYEQMMPAGGSQLMDSPGKPGSGAFHQDASGAFVNNEPTLSRGQQLTIDQQNMKMMRDIQAAQAKADAGQRAKTGPAEEMASQQLQQRLSRLASIKDGQPTGQPAPFDVMSPAVRQQMEMNFINQHTAAVSRLRDLAATRAPGSTEMQQD